MDAGSLVEVADWLRTHDGAWVTVEGVRETTEVVVVYNVEVMEYHTYFVGSAEWGFSIWRTTLAAMSPK